MKKIVSMLAFICVCAILPLSIATAQSPGDGVIELDTIVVQGSGGSGGDTGGLVPCDGAECDWGHLIELGERILNFIVTVSIFVAAVMFAYAGFLFFSDTGNAEKVAQGKKVFGAVVIGLVIILTAWLIINTILSAFTGRGLDERSDAVSEYYVDRHSSIV